MIYYQNSLLASIVSILGCIMVFVGIYVYRDFSFEEVFPILLGVAMVICGKLISMEKAFKKWWKALKNAGYEEKIKEGDVAVAQQVYNANPKKRTLKEIAKHNPQVAALIDTEEPEE